MSTFKKLSFLAAFLFLLSGLSWLADRLMPVQDSALAYTSRLDAAMQQLLLQEETIFNNLPASDSLFFSALPTETTLPYYLIDEEDGTLQFWSDNDYVPSFFRLNNQKRIQLVRIPLGDFMVVQKKLPDHPLRLISVVPLQADATANAVIKESLNWLFPEENVRFSIQRLNQGKEWEFNDESVLWVASSIPGSADNTYENLIASLLLIVAFLIALTAQLPLFKNDWKFGVAWLCLLWVIRILMLAFKLPFHWYPLALFDPAYYASSQLNPSLGDLSLNLLLVLLTVAWLRPLLTKGISSIYQKLQNRPLWIIAFQLLFAYGVFWLVLMAYKTLFYHTQYSLDITQMLDLDQFRIVSWLNFLFIGLSAFLLVLTLLKNKQPLPDWKVSLVLPLFGLLLMLFFGEERWLLAGIGAAVVLLVIKLVQQEKEEAYTGYPFALFTLVFVALISLAAARTLQNFRQQERNIYKEQLASSLLAENDPIAEFLLAEVRQKIKQDPYILNRMFNPFLSKDGIVQKIRLMLLPRYLDKYDARIFLFQPDGSLLADNTNNMLSYSSLLRKALQDGQPIAEAKNLFLLKEPQSGSAKRYLQFISLEIQGLTLGYIVLDLGLKRYQPNLLLNSLETGITPLEDLPVNHLYYAVYQDNKLVYNAGAFDYVHYFDPVWLADEALYSGGIMEGDYHHLAIQGKSDKVVVVTDKSNATYVLLQNFAFFVMLVLLVIFSHWLIFLLLKRFDLSRFSMAVKIQLYLNIAILLPLFLVVVSTLSLLRNLEKSESEQTYYKKAEDISRNLSELLELQPNPEYLNTRVAEIARYTGTDLNLYSPEGKLISSSQPGLFQQNYLSEYIHPLAYAEIKEQNSRQMITTESLGRLEYKSAYMAVRSGRTGTLLGIVSLPFFDSGIALQEQEAAVFNNLVTIFVLVFLISFFALYFLARQLTRPLRSLAEKLKLVDLSGNNEPLSWRSEDEVGKLVKEYNTMLVNLQESKKALSRTEKESAWREMAKQVAHEIKNPLTPMKLSLQHLNRMLHRQTDNSAEQQKVDKTVRSLLAQINTLSDIATSFSAFAKMPVPETVRFELVGLVHEVISLFSAEEAEIKATLPEKQLFVLGDEKLMQRTLNNLIKNGLQAVPEGRIPHIKLMLKEQGDRLLLTIADNGLGIAADIQNKVFLPNFSTKYTGSGLGLAIAKRGIEHAGGRIWFETTEGEGTVFFIELPVAN